MIHTNRTFLLELKEKHRSIGGNLHILKARRHALIMELLKLSKPFVSSRSEIGAIYRKALQELHLTRSTEHAKFLQSIIGLIRDEAEIKIETRNILGVHCKEIALIGEQVKGAARDHYDWRTTSAHFEEAIDLFEKILQAMIELASYELQLKKIGEEVKILSRRTRMIEERILPGLSKQIKSVASSIGEREREDFFRLKKFKELRHTK